VPVPPNKDLRRPTGVRRSFAIDFCFDNVAAPNDGDFSKVLNLGMGEFEPNQFSAFLMKFNRCSNHVGTVLPLFFAAADDNGLLWDQFLKGFRVAGEPRAPHRIACAE